MWLLINMLNGLLSKLILQDTYVMNKSEASDIEVDGATYADENKLGDIINIKIETLLCL